MMARSINLIVIHCSATNVNSDYTPEHLERDHRARGFNSAGYHFYIRKDGTVVKFRPLSQVGAHVQGYNANSIGVCYEGGLNAAGKASDTRTVLQKSAIITLLKKLKSAYPSVRICGHRDLSPDLDHDGTIEANEWTKICPCFNAVAEYNML